MLFTLLLTAQLSATQLQETERSWRTPDELRSSIQTISDLDKNVSVSTIGTSRNGQPIQVITLSNSEVLPIADRPAILIVAGIDGDHLLGSEVAVDIIQELLTRDDETTKSLLDSNTVYIIPQVNPDAANFYFHSVQHGQRRNIRHVDNDRDGLVDEDGGDDLNNDGYITMMRVPDLEKATLVADPEDPRLHKKPDALEGESAEFILYTEGIDNDGDGKFNEDSVGGVDINKNFMHGYVYHQDGAGPWQLSEPESKALIDFVFSHQEIAAIVVYGQHDTLSKPLKENGKDEAGAPKTIDKADEEFYGKLSKTFVELTGLKNVDQPSWDGSFVAWAYAQYGVPAFSTPLWSRPNPLEEGKESNENATAQPNETVSSHGSGQDRPGRGGFDRDAMIAEFDTDGDGELSGDERTAFRESMQDRFGGGGRPGGGGGRPGGRRGPDNSSDDSSTQSTGSSNLTPSNVGNIAQETLDELMQAAQAAGYPITEETMAEITPEQVEQYAKMAGVQVRHVKQGGSENKSESNDAKWLDYSDTQREATGFVEWTPFDHPQLGQVEIGGWVPYFKILPPTSKIDSITTKQVDFIVELASRLPKVSLETPIVKELGNGLWEIKVSVVNNGWLPSGTAMAKKNKRARPFIVRLDVPNDSIITGQKVQRIWALDGGGTRRWYRWIIQGKSMSNVSITLFSEKFGTEITTLPLKQTKGGGA